MQFQQDWPKDKKITALLKMESLNHLLLSEVAEHLHPDIVISSERLAFLVHCIVFDVIKSASFSNTLQQIGPDHELLRSNIEPPVGYG